MRFEWRRRQFRRRQLRGRQLGKHTHGENCISRNDAGRRTPGGGRLRRTPPPRPTCGTRSLARFPELGTARHQRISLQNVGRADKTRSQQRPSHIVFWVLRCSLFADERPAPKRRRDVWEHVPSRFGGALVRPVSVKIQMIFALWKCYWVLNLYMYVKISIRFSTYACIMYCTYTLNICLHTQ